METQSQLKPSLWPFCFSVKGHVKMLRLDIINSVVTTLFMIIISVLALMPETTTLIILGGDLLNDLFVCVFLGGSIYFGVQKQQPDLPVNYLIALILMGIAAFSAFLDICFQRKHFKGKRIKRNILDPPPKAGAPEKPAEEKPPAKEPEKPANKGKPGDKAAADKGKGKDKAPPKGKK
ncbi:CKLF-like MARVEL transmembrane domain-containing protein 2 isoform X4 [Heterocephalus glaber]|uniref:CKLF-like MARVEL transmembrane domain-containing protein 2 isoform X4 n=1 Tax=Heterocephalus glaber TaxID=10181 RepID=A0AAX6SXV9_HETGA|nr:CKLF-like MARVEL transmembrane domain-containing protein 2 isoform X4 [Heterocephalus glaber]